MYHTRLCKWAVIPAYVGLELERPFGQPPPLSPWGSANLRAQRLRCQYLGCRASRPGSIPGLHRSLEKTGPALEYAGTFQYPFPYSMSLISTIWLLGPSFPVRSLFTHIKIPLRLVSSPVVLGGPGEQWTRVIGCVTADQFFSVVFMRFSPLCICLTFDLEWWLGPLRVQCL